MHRGSVLNLKFRLTNLCENESKGITSNKDNYCHKNIVDGESDREDASSKDLPGTFEIDGLAQVRFKFVKTPPKPNDMIYDDDPISIKISSKLSDLVLTNYRGQIVYLHVNCKELEYSKKWVCSEEWTDLVVGAIEVSEDNWNGDQYDIKPFELTMTVSKKETVSFSKLYDDTELTDFQLNTADSEVGVAVHKVLLSAHSDIFKTMFCKEWKETTMANVQIQGVTLQTLQYFKKYIYLNTLPDNMVELCPLLALASHYMMDILVSECITKIIQKVTSENLQSLLEHACANNIPELTFAIIEQTPSEVVDSARLNRKQKKECKEELPEQQSMYLSSEDLEKEIP